MLKHLQGIHTEADSRARQPQRFLASIVILAGALVASCTSPPGDFTVRGPDGRQILIRHDGTWRYAGDAADEAPRAGGEARLTVVGRTDEGRDCRITLELANRLPYEIHSLVPTFVAIRASGYPNRQVSVNFNGLFPEGSQRRTALYEGISCAEIAHLQMIGGDRCTMGDLDLLRASGDECLSRVRIVPNRLVPVSR